MELTRRSISHPASGAITFGREPPQTGAAFRVMPRSMSTMRCRPMIWCDSSTMAEAPSSNAPPAWEPRPSTRITKRPTPLRAVTQAPPAPAGSGISTDAACAASCSISQRLVGLPTSSSGVSSRTIGRVVAIFCVQDAADGVECEETAGLHVVDAGAVRFCSVHAVGHGVQRAVRPHRVQMASDEDGLAFPGVRAIRLSPKPSRPGMR